jgi:hypothetical protein
MSLIFVRAKSISKIAVVSDGEASALIRNLPAGGEIIAVADGEQPLGLFNETPELLAFMNSVKRVAKEK